METYKELIAKVKPEFDKSLMFLEKELAQVRTGRASPSLVENIVVNCFGENFPLKQLAAISIPEPRQILIQPWDKSYLEGIVSALSKTGVASNPIVDKEVIRVNLPSLTEDYRKELLKLISEKQEEVRKVMRKNRDEVWSDIQNRARLGEIREDDKFKAKEGLQDLIDDYGEKIDEIGERKRKEIEL